ncbi:MAG: hypothetical protein K2W95_34085 [Candidatus Obscuribacterales bacterium]|nr:hypothetical protein [Candidatus Obscuribacterales bacterium]
MGKRASRKSVTETRLQSLELRSGTIADIHKLVKQTAQAELLQNGLDTETTAIVEGHLDQVRNADFLPRLVFGGGLKQGSSADLKFWQDFRKDLGAIKKRIDAAMVLIQATKEPG